MANEFCPRCNALASMVVSAIEREKKDDEGKIFKIRITSYHCNVCHTFMRSTNEKILKHE